MSKSKLDHNNRLILLVDDSPEYLRLLSKILKSKGFNVEKTVNGKTAIEIAKNQCPDLILLDINMPKMNGYEVYRQLKTQEKTANIPIIFMGTLDQVINKIRNFDIPIIDCITKPFQESEILSRVESKLIVYQKHLEIIAYNQRLDQEKEEHKRFTKALITANQNLQSVVLVDAVTKVANRRKFDEYLNLQWQKLASEKLPLSLLICNLDFANNYNNADIDLTADNFLQQIATEIKSEVKRSTDLVASYENEKFAVILPNTNSQGAVYVSMLIQKKVNSLKINNTPFIENDFLTLAIGVATIFPSVKKTPKTLIHMVEKALNFEKIQRTTKL
ncbi:response regulator [Anabaena sphaerica FACHB-251]|uniref:Response regulator n=2 Tax=Anabaena TaxID=1163 RepID=A0A926WDJ6_9NOST|nr:response regulator [Anabaena sphaerica FACHB-251]